MKVDHLIRLGFVVLFICIDVHQFALPITVIEEEVLQEAFKNCPNGRCPFVVQTTHDNGYSISMHVKYLEDNFWIIS